ncbi:MAG: hypothetical protein KF729_18325 [Sandaracinaceae bacterium]|nr:hypothetical protein [Sandaracinaceae bacterium]
MPVTKYRSVQEMPRPERVADAELLARIRAVMARARLFAPPLTAPRGVTKFRSIEEADAAREAQTIERMRRSRRAER